MHLHTMRAAARLLAGMAEELRARPLHVGAVLPPVDRCGTRGPARGEEPDPLVYHEKKVPSWIPARERALRPAVGHAQAQLNAFLRLFDEATSGSAAGLAQLCRGDVVRARQFRAKLPVQIAIDCRFGDQTELAARLFQTCQGLKDDGRIGPDTWRLLNAVPRPPAAGSVIVGQSADGLLAIIQGFIGVADLTRLAQRTSFSQFTRTSLIVGHAARAGGRLLDRVDDPASVDASRPISAVFHALAGTRVSPRPVLLVISGIHPQETAAQTPGARLRTALRDRLRAGTSPWLEHFNVVLMEDVNPLGSGRANASGVNLNRNFFGLAKERGALAAIRPPGDCEPKQAPNVPRTPDAARQPETQVILDVIAAIQPNAIVALHGTRRNNFEGVFVDAPPDVARAGRVILQTAAIADDLAGASSTRFRGNRPPARVPPSIFSKLDPIAFLYRAPSRNVVWPDQTDVGPFSLGSWASCRGYPVFTVEPQFLTQGTTSPLPSSLVSALANALERSIRPNG